MILPQDFEQCAAANGWEDDAKLAKLPAFLQGPAASHFDSFADDEENSFAQLTVSLSHCFLPVFGREPFEE